MEKRPKMRKYWPLQNYPRPSGNAAPQRVVMSLTRRLSMECGNVLHSWEYRMMGVGGGYRSGPGRVAKMDPRLFWGPKKTGARAATQEIG